MSKEGKEISLLQYVWEFVHQLTFVKALKVVASLFALGKMPAFCKGCCDLINYAVIIYWDIRDTWTRRKAEHKILVYTTNRELAEQLADAHGSPLSGDARKSPILETQEKQPQSTQTVLRAKQHKAKPTNRHHSTRSNARPAQGRVTPIASLTLETNRESVFTQSDDSAA